MPKISVLLADDHSVVRSGLRKMLDQEPDIRVVGEADDGFETLRLVEKLNPDVLLLDIEMPGQSGLEVAQQLHDAKSPVRILALSAYDDREYALNLLAMGAAGYLTKEEAPRSIIKAVRGTYEGKDGWLSQRMSAKLAGSLLNQPAETELSEQELEVLRLVDAAKTNTEVGEALGIENSQVEGHLESAFKKLGVTSRAEAARQAAEAGWFETRLGKIRVLIAEEILLLCNVIASLLEDEPDMEVMDCVTSVEAAVAQAANCDVVLASTALPDNGALKITKRLVQEQSAAKVLVIGLEETTPAIVGYVEAGASGYVLHDHSADELIETIRAIYRDQALVSSSVASALMSRVNQLTNLMPEGEPAIPVALDLTPREQEVFQLVAQGLRNAEIAEHLFIEVGTVKNHIHNIFEKLEISDRREVTAFVPLTKEQS